MVSQSTPQSAPSSALSRRLSASRGYYWFVVAYLVTLSALGSFVNDMFTPAMPAMTRYFGCSIPTVQLALTAGMIGLGLGEFVLGPISDRVGRKPVLVGSVLTFIVAAVVSVFSPTIWFFIGCRLVMGMGASGGYFLARTIPADIYTGRALAKIMALVGAINGIAPASAPVIGGITADAWGWKGIFIVLAAFALIVLALSPWMYESLPPQRRVRGPLRNSMAGYVALLHNRPFIVHTCLKGFSLGLLFAYIAAAPFILQTRYGLSQTTYGLVIGANAILVAVGSMLALKFKPLKRAAYIGAIITAAAVAAQAVALCTVHSLALYEVLILIMLFGFGLGLIFTTSNTLAMNEGRAHAGEASALLGIAGYVVGATVAPLVGIGDVLHATALTFVALAVLTLLLSLASRRLAPDLGN